MSQNNRKLMMGKHVSTTMYMLCTLLPQFSHMEKEKKNVKNGSELSFTKYLDLFCSIPNVLIYEIPI